MRVTVDRSGGFAGINRSWVVSAEQTTQPDTLHSLVEACPWPSGPQAQPIAPETNAADGFCYELRAGDHLATLPESAVEGPWRTLIDYVMEHNDGPT